MRKIWGLGGEKMANVLDVAQYILQKQGPMSVMKLQKLIYYCQAWSLVWDEKPLFNEEIEAWAMGPVVRELYEVHKGSFELRSLDMGNSDSLSSEQKETVDAILGTYGNQTAQWLSDLTHFENPWNEAREGIPEGASCIREITLASMHEYYSSLPPSDNE